MAEIMEVGESKKDIKKSFEKLKKKVKEKPIFFVALIVVVVIALYKLVTKPKEDDTVTYAYTPTGFDGYPTSTDSMLDDFYNNGGSSDFGGGSTGGGSNTNIEDNYFLDEKYDKEYRERMDEENTGLLEKIFDMDTTASVGDVYGKDGSLIFSRDKSYSVITKSGAERDLQESLEKADNMEYRNNILDQMKSNANAWGSATKSEREILEKENERLSKSVGLTKGSDGVWRNPDGSRAWDEATSSSTSTKVTYDKNVDYAQKIKDAKASGASQAEIDRLEAQRKAKIAGENLNNDGTKKTSISSSSSKSSSSSSSSKSSGSSSSSTPKQGTSMGKVTWSKTTNKDGSTTNVAKDSSGKTVAKYTTAAKKNKK